jgi:Williams-Beuren syndrome DDT (WSD), D-TOX E motif
MALEPEAPPPEPIIDLDGDTKMSNGTEEDVDEEVIDSEDEAPHKGRSLRRGGDRAADRKRKREEEQEKKAKEKEAKAPKVPKPLAKCLRDIQKQRDTIQECEEEIKIIEGDLREANCPRTIVLGKDRFWNRYYWFERNGMPFGGLPDSSTAEAGYANGRLWVQGPDEIERTGFIALDHKEQQAYMRGFKVNLWDRKNIEEGEFKVYTGIHWGYYDEPEDVDKLLGYLDNRGNREVKLKKEIMLYRDHIVASMEARKKYIGIGKEDDDKVEEEEELNLSERPKRMSTRVKPAANVNTQRFLVWTNTTAISENGHLHSEQPAPAKKGKKNVKGGANAKGVAVKKQKATTTRSGMKY